MREETILRALAMEHRSVRQDRTAAILAAMSPIVGLTARRDHIDKAFRLLRQAGMLALFELPPEENRGTFGDSTLMDLYRVLSEQYGAILERKYHESISE